MYVARVLGPDKLGISAYWLALATPISLAVCLNLDGFLIRHYLVGPADQRLQLGNAVTMARLVLGALPSSVLLCISITHGLLGGQPGLAPLAAGVTVFATVGSAAWIMQANEKVGLQMKAQAIQGGITLALSAILLRADSPVGSDFLISSISSVVMMLVMWRWIRVNPAANVTTRPILDSVSSYLRHILAGKWFALSGFLIYTYTSLENVLIGVWIGEHSLGVYRAATQVSLAVGSLTGLVPIVFYPGLVKLAMSEPIEVLRASVSGKTRMLEMAAAALLLVLALPAYYLFALVFGPAYSDGALPCAILVAGRLVAMCNALTIWALRALCADRSVLVILASGAIFSIGANSYLINTHGILGAALVNCASELLVLVLSRRMLAVATIKSND